MFSTQGFGNNGNMNTGLVEHRFSPYTFNGGTVLGIAGEDFAIVASDTRLSEGYAIQSRESPKCYKLTDTTVIGCTAFHGDCLALTKIIDARITMYHCNPKTVNSGAIAGMLSIILSGKRFFPYYVYNIIGGLDMEGKGAVYNFDPVGSYQRAPYMAAGSAAAMLQPLLDNQVPHSVLGKGAVYSFDAVGYYQRDTCKVAVGGSMAAMIQPILDSQIGFKNREFVQHLPLTKEKAVQLVKDMFISAAERDVYTGDALQICVITKEGIKTEMFPLRDD